MRIQPRQPARGTKATVMLRRAAFGAPGTRSQSRTVCRCMIDAARPNRRMTPNSIPYTAAARRRICVRDYYVNPPRIQVDAWVNIAIIGAEAFDYFQKLTAIRSEQSPSLLVDSHSSPLAVILIAARDAQLFLLNSLITFI